MNDISLYENVPPIENNFTVKFRLYDSLGTLFTHWHEHIELLYIRTGQCDFICSGKSFSARADDLIVVNSTQIHSFTVKEQMNYFCILIYPEFFSDIDFNNIILKNIISKDKYIKDCFNDIYSEFVSDKPGNDMMLKSHTYRLMAYLMRNYTESHLMPHEHNTHASKLIRLNTLLEYISENYNEKITTGQLAKMCYLSESHFCRFFKSAIGKSVTDYINEYRIEKATVLLSNTDESITSVALSVGFNDINYFSRVFRKIKNISPTEYKTLQKKHS